MSVAFPVSPETTRMGVCLHTHDMKVPHTCANLYKAGVSTMCVWELYDSFKTTTKVHSI